MRAKIHNALLPLAGLPLWDVGRATDLTWLQFGQRRMVKDFRGEAKEVGEYALHLQCVWRLVQGEQVIIGQRDLYYPATPGRTSPEVPAGFNWDVQGANRLDYLLDEFFHRSNQQLIVEHTEVGCAAAFAIFFRDNFVLEIFPNDSFDEEHWRLFRPYLNEPHFVVTGKSASEE
jgi:hypothetical protein